MSDKTIFNVVKDYINEGVTPFHMPGHKRKSEFFRGINFLDYDVTEFGDMDNLHNPDGAILNAEKFASKVYESFKSFYITNGSSCGILISIMATCKKGNKIIVARNCHKSVYNGLILSGATPLYVYPDTMKNNLNTLIGGINPSDIEEILKSEENVKAIILTSVTYEGFCSDIEKIYSLAKKYNTILIVDEAHGAHFNFSTFFPKSSVKNADIIIQSLHKTLPCLGQSSILHISERINSEKIIFYRNVFNTTSPSYMMMCMMDYALHKLSVDKNIFDEYIKNIISTRNILKKYHRIQLVDEKNVDINIYDVDLSRFTFLINSNYYTGFEIEKILANDFKIQVELSSFKHITLISSVADDINDFEKLINAIEKIDTLMISGDSGNESKIKYGDLNFNFIVKKKELALTLMQVVNKKSKKIKFKDSVGCISKEFITPYPPGIPAVVPGEIISGELINDILFFIGHGGKVIEPTDKSLEYIEVVTED